MREKLEKKYKRNIRKENERESRRQKVESRNEK